MKIYHNKSLAMSDYGQLPYVFNLQARIHFALSDSICPLLIDSLCYFGIDIVPTSALLYKSNTFFRSAKGLIRSYICSRR
jgi:hypothetical protein